MKGMMMCTCKMDRKGGIMMWKINWSMDKGGYYVKIKGWMQKGML